MPSELQWIPLNLTRGINDFDQRTQLQDGDATVMENYEWLPNGGITPRPQLLAAGTAGVPTGEPTSLLGRGLTGLWYESGVRKLVVASSDGAEFTLTKTDFSEPDGFNAYTEIESGLVTDAAYLDLPVAFAVGNQKLVYTNPGFPAGRVRSYDGSTVTELDTDNIAGRSLSYHLNRFWTGGSAAEPSNLRFTEIGDEAEWNLDENFIPVGQDDGEPVVETIGWDRGLVIAKYHSLWFLSGIDLDSFALSPIDAKVGVADGRTLQTSRYGVFLVGFDGNVYLWDGGAITRITERHRVETPPPLGYMACAYVADKLLVSASGSDRIDVFDPTEGRWRVETFSENLPQDLLAYDDRFLVATTGDETRLLSQREEIGPFALGSNRSPSGDTGIDTYYEASTGEHFLGGTFAKGALRHLYLRYRQWFGQIPGAGFTVTPLVDGVELEDEAKEVDPMQTSGVNTIRLDFGADVDGWSFGVKISTTSETGKRDTYTFEEMVLGVSVEGIRR